jgi:hypothetical protein
MMALSSSRIDSTTLREFSVATPEETVPDWAANALAQSEQLGFDTPTD